VARGHRFRTKSDSEIALHLYEEYGPECLHHLRGEYAFVIWDERNQRLIAGRDRFGVKPLFYAEHNGALYLASEVKALFAMGVPARWSEESVYAGGFVRVCHVHEVVGQCGVVVVSQTTGREFAGGEEGDVGDGEVGEAVFAQGLGDAGGAAEPV